MVRLLFHMIFFHLSHLSLHSHQSWLRSTITCALILADSMISDTVTITLSPLQTHRYTEYCIAYKDLLHAIPLVDISPFHRYRNSRHYSCMFGIHWYAATLVHWIPSCYIDFIVTWMLDTLLSHVHTSLLHMLTTRVYMYALCPSYCHMTHRAPYMYYCSLLSLYSSYMIVSCYWYGFPVTGHESCWYAICGIPHLLFPLYCSRDIVPVSRYIVLVILLYAINRALVQLPCYPYHVLYLFLLPCILNT